MRKSRFTEEQIIKVLKEHGEVLDHYTEESFPNLMDVVSYFNEGMRNYRRQVHKRHRPVREGACPPS